MRTFRIPILLLTVLAFPLMPTSFSVLTSKRPVTLFEPLSVSPSEQGEKQSHVAPGYVTLGG